MRLVYAGTGLWAVHLASYSDLSRVERASLTEYLFTLERLVVQCPVLVVATLIALGHVSRRVVSQSTLAQSGVAEALLFGAAAVAFILNPSPFPYNLLLVVPFAYLLVVRVLLDSLESLRSHPRAVAWVGGALALVHVATFAHASARHLQWSNTRQEALMAVAESMTDPAHDRVYDASGLVVTRRATQRWWYLHSLNMPVYGTAKFPKLADVFKTRPAAVVIRSYRTDWLPPDDQRFLEAHYLPLADDFWVLGAVTSNDRSWNCLHAGRYELLVASDTGGAPPGVYLDGVQINPGSLILPAGMHQLHVRGSGSAALTWIGPRIEAPRTLSEHRHEYLFVNWY